MSTQAISEWKLERIGKFSEPKPFRVTRERVAAYAEATNDEHPLHRSGELAPPVFAIVPVFDTLTPPMLAFVPGEIAMTVVHGEQDFRFHAPIVPGQTLLSRGGVVGVHGTSTGVQVIVKGVTETGAGELIVEQYLTGFFRGAQLDLSAGVPLTQHRFPARLRGSDRLAVITQTFDPDTTERYSRASGDQMPIHLDDQVAKSVGLPGIIVHGLCTMAYTSRAVIASACPEDPTGLRRLAVRFSKTVQPSDSITTFLWNAGTTAEGTRKIAYETASNSGDMVIKDGLAEVRQSPA